MQWSVRPSWIKCTMPTWSRKNQVMITKSNFSASASLVVFLIFLRFPVVLDPERHAYNEQSWSRWHLLRKQSWWFPCWLSHSPVSVLRFSFVFHDKGKEQSREICWWFPECGCHNGRWCLFLGGVHISEVSATMGHGEPSISLRRKIAQMMITTGKTRRWRCSKYLVQILNWSFRSWPLQCRVYIPFLPYATTGPILKPSWQQESNNGLREGIRIVTLYWVRNDPVCIDYKSNRKIKSLFS